MLTKAHAINMAQMHSAKEGERYCVVTHRDPNSPDHYSAMPIKRAQAAEHLRVEVVAWPDGDLDYYPATAEIADDQPPWAPTENE